MTPDLPENSKNPAPKGLHALGTALLMAGSAIFGGLAVVLWNRKALSRLRLPPASSDHSSLPDEEDT
jgi:hypothetical protein